MVQILLLYFVQVHSDYWMFDAEPVDRLRLEQLRASH